MMPDFNDDVFLSKTGLSCFCVDLTNSCQTVPYCSFFSFIHFIIFDEYGTIFKNWLIVAEKVAGTKVLG